MPGVAVRDRPHDQHAVPEREPRGLRMQCRVASRCIHPFAMFAHSACICAWVISPVRRAEEKRRMRLPTARAGAPSDLAHLNAALQLCSPSGGRVDRSPECKLAHAHRTLRPRMVKQTLDPPVGRYLVSAAPFIRYVALVPSRGRDTTLSTCSVCRVRCAPLPKDRFMTRNRTLPPARELGRRGRRFVRASGAARMQEVDR